MFSIIPLANFTSYQKTFVVESGEWAFPSQYICPVTSPCWIPKLATGCQNGLMGQIPQGVLLDLTAVYFIALAL